MLFVQGARAVQRPLRLFACHLILAMTAGLRHRILDIPLFWQLSRLVVLRAGRRLPAKECRAGTPRVDRRLHVGHLASMGAKYHHVIRFVLRITPSLSNAGGCADPPVIQRGDI